MPGPGPDARGGMLLIAGKGQVKPRDLPDTRIIPAVYDGPEVEWEVEVRGARQGESPQAQREEEAQAEMKSRQNGRALILVVERDPYVRSLESFFLERAGYAVEFADNGEKGLEMARSLKPDILIAEILVAGMDGLSVCKALKSHPQTRSIIVLIFSILEAEQRAMEAGADGFLRKPLDDERMIRSVERLLEQHTDAPWYSDGTN